MSGIQTGTKLERLYVLRDRIAHEIAVAERENALTQPKPKPVEDKPATGGDRSQQDRLAALDITAHDVKVWAVEAGLISAVRRGRVSNELIEGYEHAHPELRPRLVMHPDHQVTVTGNGPFNRAYVDCSCGYTRTCASKHGAERVALMHHHEHAGCNCPPHVVASDVHPSPGPSRPVRNTVASGR